MTPPYRITVCGIEELADHCEMGVSHVLSILDPDHPVPQAFGSFGEHAKLELRFHDVLDPAPGEIAPAPEDVARLLAFGRDLDAEPPAEAHLLVHCHAGISRSTAAMTLMLAQSMPECSAEAIVRTVFSIRDKAWPNLRMIEMGDDRLGRHGTLAAAAARLYARQLLLHPHLAEFMTDARRRREVAAGRAAQPL